MFSTRVARAYVCSCRGRSQVPAFSDSPVAEATHAVSCEKKVWDLALTSVIPVYVDRELVNNLVCNVPGKNEDEKMNI